MSPVNVNPNSKPESTQKAAGLRERKKAKNRASIQQHALRLFREQGYEATTIDQIAEAADVSVSTVFRYFHTKEDLVVSDDYDFLFIRAFRAQPAELSPVEALRRAIYTTFEDLSPEELRGQHDRDVLMATVPELWAASLGNVTRTMSTITELIAERTGAEPDDMAVRALSGAAFGMMLDVMLRWARSPEQDTAGELDQLFAYLEESQFDRKWRT